MLAKKRNLAQVEFRQAPNRKIAELLSASTVGTEQVTFRIVDMDPASQQKPRHPHIHQTFEETMFVLNGEGRLWIEGELYKLSEGDALLVPRGLCHLVVNAIEIPLRLACFFPIADGVGVDQQEREDILLIPRQLLENRTFEA
ncbi:MAG: cupin domain-containing protein [Acidobacteriota bacterium]